VLLSRLLASSPLRHPSFRLFYFGSIGVALGYTMQATIAAWLMATLTPSAFMVALVQTASTAPTLLFGLVAGALADIADRRRIILITQIVLLTAAIVLGGLTVAGVTGPAALLALTFLIGAGFTFYLPAQQASVNDLVSRAELPSAVALSAVAFNVARAIGPALSGACRLGRFRRSVSTTVTRTSTPRSSRPTSRCSRVRTSSTLARCCAYRLRESTAMYSRL